MFAPLCREMPSQSSCSKLVSRRGAPAGPWLVSHHKVTHIIKVWGHWIVRRRFILIGLYVCYEGGIVEVWDTKIAAATQRW